MTTLPAGWMPIESAPKDGTGILGYWNTGALHDCSFGAVKFHRGAWWETNEDYKVSQPTHWMPLPAAPCQTCNGHGMVGGLTPHSGYDAEPCPDCTPPATTQDAPITVSLDPDPRGVSVGVWQGSRCIYNGAHAVPVSAQDDAKDVPAEVMSALDRMCTPLDPSWLKGATAEADARCMQTIRDYILRRPAPAAGDALPTIKGVAITGGYVVVTPSGWGEDKPQKVRDAILRLFPVNPAYTPKPEADEAASQQQEG